MLLNADLELGIETDASTASGSHNAHPVRKRIAIKLKPPGKAGKEKKQGRSKAAKDARDGTLGREGQSGKVHVLPNFICLLSNPNIEIMFTFEVDKQLIKEFVDVLIYNNNLFLNFD